MITLLNSIIWCWEPLFVDYYDEMNISGIANNFVIYISKDRKSDMGMAVIEYHVNS